MGMFGKMKNWFLTDEAKERAAKEKEDAGDEVVSEEIPEDSSDASGSSDEVAEKKVAKKIVKKKVVKKVSKVDEEDAEELERKREAFEAEQEEIRLATEERKRAIHNRDTSTGGNSIEDIRRRLQEISGDAVPEPVNRVTDESTEEVEVSEEVAVSEDVEVSDVEVSDVVETAVAVGTSDVGEDSEDGVLDAFQASLARDREAARMKELVLKKKEEEERYFSVMMDLPPRSSVDETIVDALGAGVPEWYLREHGFIVDEEDAFKDIVSKVVVGLEDIRLNAGLTPDVNKTVVEFDVSSAARLAETLGSAVPVPSVTVQAPVTAYVPAPVPLAEQEIEVEDESIVDGVESRSFEVSEDDSEDVETDEVVVETTVTEIEEDTVTDSVEDIEDGVESGEDVGDFVVEADDVESVEPVEEAESVESVEEVESVESVEKEDRTEESDSTVVESNVIEDEFVRELSKESLVIEDEPELRTPSETLDEGEEVDVEDSSSESYTANKEIASDESVDVDDTVDEHVTNDFADDETVEVEETEENNRNEDVSEVDTRNVSEEADTDTVTEVGTEPVVPVSPIVSSSLSDRLNSLAKTLIKREVLNVNKESNEVLVKESIKDDLGVLRAKYSSYKLSEEESKTVEVGKDLAEEITLEAVESKKVIDGDEYSISAEDEATILEAYSLRELWVLTTDELYVEQANAYLVGSRYRVNQLLTAKDFLVATRNADNLIVITQKIPDGVKPSISNYLKHLKTSELKGRFASVSDSLVNADIIETVFSYLNVEELDAYYDTHSRSNYERKTSSMLDMIRMADFDISDALRENADVEVVVVPVEEPIYEELTFEEDTIDLDSSDGENGVHYTEYGDIDLDKMLEN